MRSLQNLALARAVGILAIISLPAFIWFGWWQLAVSFGLAVVSALLAPGTTHRPAEGRLRRVIRGFQQRTHPHSWRPGHW
jgi:hypothetical protein